MDSQDPFKAPKRMPVMQAAAREEKSKNELHDLESTR
jgi:hypothetical protein